MARRCSSAVSYTHLDVYKRQIQMYLAMGYFREENGTALIQTLDNAILAMQEAADDGIVENRAEAAEAAGLDVELSLIHISALSAVQM